MIEEKVTLETAELAKTKGFQFVDLPTQDLLERWLREIHQIRVFVGWRPNIKKWDVHTFHLGLSGSEYAKRHKAIMKLPAYDSFELARETGLREALNSI